MKLIKLIMSAFGPYKGIQEIDFNRIYDKKLFLITGPTGSGKTSIFDAIAFALYGQSSGNDRDGDNFRSHFSSVDEKTFVSLEFDIRGIRYYVKRSPKQETKKLKGDGITTRGADAELKIGDKIYTGVVEVNNKIIEIIGINYDQFKQIVMLPQGEFRKLLEANSLDREAIFRKIFKTESFLSIQERLKEKTNYLKSEIGNNYNLINNYVSNIITDLDSELDLLIKSEYKDYDKIITFINEKILEDNKKLTLIYILIKEKEDSIYKYETKINDAKLLNKKFIQKEELLKQKEDLLKSKNIMDDLEIKVQKANSAQVIYQIQLQIEKISDIIFELTKGKEENIIQGNLLKEKLDSYIIDLEEKQKSYDKIENLKEELFILKKQLKKYDEYYQMTKELSILKHDKDKYNELIISKNESHNIIKENIKCLMNKIEDFNSLIPKLSDLKINKQIIENKVNKIIVIKNIILDISKLEQEHIKLSKVYNEKKNFFEEKRNHYYQLFDLYKSGQAGLLAESLNENMPCPVCGSKTHPNKAIKISNVPSSEELDLLKIKLTDCEKISNEAYNNVLSIFSEIKEKEKILSSLDSEFINKDINKYEKMLIESNLILDDINKEILKIEKEVNKKEEIDEKVKLLNKEVINNELEMDNITKKYNDLDNEDKIKMSLIKKFEEEFIINYPNSLLIEEKINEIENNIKLIINDYQSLIENINNIKSKLLVLDANIKNSDKNIELYNESLVLEKEKFANKLAEMNFKDENEYKMFLINKEDINLYELKIKDYYLLVSYTDKLLNVLNDELIDKNIINIDMLLDEQSKLKEENEDLRNREKDLHSIIQNNSRILRDIGDLYKKVKNKIDEYSIYSDISKVANGDNLQKLTFERFVLAAYFDEIIIAANIRLADMTNGRYILCRKEEKGKGASQQGLDLEVFDNYTSRNRTVKTLSGGEAFITSLALALGLADVVQSYSGGIQLDTMFIDEGFGSLDPESLENAIATLVNIQQSGRLVGIISHVEELKERIDVKLEITPSKQGSIAKFIL